MLHIIQRPETDPYFNLAAEEHLFKSATNNTFMIWRNEESVIIGKHQNRSREINHDFIASQNIPVIRRITGGGTVYQDPGNINFSFVYTDRKENLVDYRFFTKPVLEFLKKLGLNAAFEEKSNIVVDGLKVSGNSAHVFREKVLHHGSLLFDTDLEKLEHSIRSREERYDDKSVRSVRKKVINISHLLKNKVSIESFLSSFTKFISAYYGDATHITLSESDTQAIQKLINEKYSKPEWNIGYSPAYRYSGQWSTGGDEYDLELSAREGKIEKITFHGPVHHSALLRLAEKVFTGQFHDKKTLSELIRNTNFESVQERQMMNRLLNHLF
ncbi:MAG: lipoate--protein ligase [Bacteroidales bacterium]|nr:lipoate--protein ligase [Bacteroidales bacterium]